MERWDYMDVQWEKIKRNILDDDFRLRFQLKMVYTIFAFVAMVMTGMNYLTKKWFLMDVTLVFGILCILNLIYILFRKALILVSCLFFCICCIGLFVVLIVTGIPDGFSVLWICILPSASLLLMGRKWGSVFCIVVFAMVTFFFWIPAGRELLQYDYGYTFMMRFPVLLLSIYGVSWFFETIRVITRKALADSKAEYEYMYVHDALTGLYNRYGFNEIMEEIAETEHNTDGVFFMIMDLDYFKNINDTYGHWNGDRVLKAVAHTIETITCDEARVCRWGGEEFAIILPQKLSNEDAMNRAEKIREAVEMTEVYSEGEKIKITVSIGVVSKTSKDVLGTGALMKLADECLYEAKENGRNQVVMRIV